jgi:hypothetical protein
LAAARASPPAEGRGALRGVSQTEKEQDITKRRASLLYREEPRAGNNILRMLNWKLKIENFKVPNFNLKFTIAIRSFGGYGAEIS